MMNRKTNEKPNDVLIYETVIHILNNLSDQGIKVWLDMGELMPNLKGGKYAATEKKTRKQYSNSAQNGTWIQNRYSHYVINKNGGVKIE